MDAGLIVGCWLDGGWLLVVCWCVCSLAVGWLMCWLFAHKRACVHAYNRESRALLSVLKLCSIMRALGCRMMYVVQVCVGCQLVGCWLVSGRFLVGRWQMARYDAQASWRGILERQQPISKNWRGDVARPC